MVARLLLALLVAVAAASATAVAQNVRPVPAVLYEGARLVTGDGSAPIERSAFLVENGRFTRVGRQGEVQIGRASCRERVSLNV